MIKQKGQFDFKQRHIQKIYQEKIKYRNMDKSKEVMDIFLFMFLVFIGSCLLAIFEILFH